MEFSQEDRAALTEQILSNLFFIKNSLEALQKYHDKVVSTLEKIEGDNAEWNPLQTLTDIAECEVLHQEFLNTIEE